MESSNGMPGASPTPADSARRIKDATTSVVDRTKQAASERIHDGAQRANSSVHSAASALRRAADGCADENAWIGTALRKSADGIERAGDSIANGDLNEAVHYVNDLARRHPAVFLGSCVALGFALARVGKTAMEEVRPVDDSYPLSEM